jgi:hypothetical protein
MIDPSGDAVAFDRFLAASTPEVATVARALRRAVLDGLPDAAEWFDPGTGLLAFGATRTMGDLMFAIIPHKATSICSSSTESICPTRTDGSRARANEPATSRSARWRTLARPG